MCSLPFYRSGKLEEAVVLECLTQGRASMRESGKYLIRGWMQCKQLLVSVGFPLIIILMIYFFIWGTIQKIWKQSIWEGVFQVKNAASPAAPWCIIYGHGASFKVILRFEEIKCSL